MFVCRCVRASQLHCLEIVPLHYTSTLCSRWSVSGWSDSAVGRIVTSGETDSNLPEHGNALKVDECETQKVHTDAWTGTHTHTNTPAYLSAFWDTGCRRQAGMTGQDMLITDRTGLLTDEMCVCMCVCAYVFGRQSG